MTPKKEYVMLQTLFIGSLYAGLIVLVVICIKVSTSK